MNKLLNEAEQLLLTEVRTAKWKLETYEFAYDANIRWLNFWKIMIDFLSILIAVVFLFLQYVFKDKNATTHEWLGYFGTALSIAVILLAIWGAFARWTDQIEKKQELSREARSLIIQQAKLIEVRPIDEKKLRAWLRECAVYEEERKHILAAVPRIFLKRGFQHLGNTYSSSGVVCSMCGKQWNSESNKRARWTWIGFWGCENCGV